MAFTPFSAGDRLESMSTQTTFRSQTSPLLQSTVGSALLYQDTTTAALFPTALTLTLPDGRLNVGTHLPLLAKRYKYLSTLGEGVSAQVVLVEDTFRPGHLVTVKVMRRQHTHTGHREARALRFLHSRRIGGSPAPGVVRLFDTFTFGAHFCLVLERLHPRLLDWVAESAAAPPKHTLPALRKLAYQLLVTVAFLHRHGVVHADIKPDNLLLRHPQGCTSIAAALVDFGGAFSVTERDMTALLAEVQTLPYRAPEVALGLPCGAAVDEWSVGVVLTEAALKRPLFPCTSPMELVQGMVGQLGPLPGDMVASSSLGQQYDLTTLMMPPPPPLSPLPPFSTTTSTSKSVSVGVVPSATLAAVLGRSDGSSSTALQTAASAAVPDALRQLDPCFAGLVLQLMHYDQSQRCTASEALLHPFFAEMNVLATVSDSSGVEQGGGCGGVPVVAPPPPILLRRHKAPPSLLIVEKPPPPFVPPPAVLKIEEEEEDDNEDDDDHEEEEVVETTDEEYKEEEEEEDDEDEDEKQDHQAAGSTVCGGGRGTTTEKVVAMAVAVESTAKRVSLKSSSSSISESEESAAKRARRRDSAAAKGKPWWMS